MNDLIRASALLTGEDEEDIVEPGNEEDVGKSVGEEKEEDDDRIDMDMDAEMNEWQ